MGLLYINHAQIDFHKWDDCISQSADSLIYCQSFYLNNAANGQWDAIVLNDYEAVMPLPYRKKYGIRYLYQPAFLPQAGIFFKTLYDTDITADFIKLAASRFKLIEINLNHANRELNFSQGVTELKNNYIIDITGGYTDKADQYKSNFCKNLKKANKHTLLYRPSVSYSNTIDLFKTLYGDRFNSVREKDYINFAENCRYLHERDQLVVREVLMNDELLASVILLKDKKRLYNIASCTTAAGRKTSANYFLYDRVIEEFSGSHLILDMEGSDVEGIADFYRSMNPINEQYISLRINTLPPIIKLFKS